MPGETSMARNGSPNAPGSWRTSARASESAIGAPTAPLPPRTTTSAGDGGGGGGGGGASSATGTPSGGGGGSSASGSFGGGGGAFAKSIRNRIVAAIGTPPRV